MEVIEHELKEGRTIPVPAAMLRDEQGLEWVIHHGIMIKPPTDVSPGIARLMKKLDLRIVFERVRREINKLKDREPTRGPGRKRGFAEKS